jgi:5-methyltetrahydrofolate--homocysteine methyltransferase
MDGAMGTELQRHGLAAGECGELWNLTHPERVQRIHTAYRHAGASCLVTNTFQANPAALGKHGLQSRWEDINRAAGELARSAAGTEALVLADIGPGIGLPLQEPTIYRQFAQSFGSADGLLLETQSSITDLERLVRGRDRADEQGRLPILFCVTYLRDASGQIVTWEEKQPPEYYAERATELGVDAVGVNCGREIDMQAVIEITRRYRRVTNLPLLARPNAGTPVPIDGRWVYPRGPEEMAGQLPELLAAGAIMIGGCCGTTPEYIAAFRSVLTARGEV